MAKLIEREQVAGMNIHYQLYSLDYFLECQQELGFKTIELWGGAPHFYLDSVGYEDVKAVKKKINDRGLEVCVFTPENCTYQYQFAAQTPLLFEKSYQYFANGLRVTSELGCGIMQCNSGWGYWNEDREEAWKRSREMLSRLADKAGELGITMAMEALRPQESNLVTTLKDCKRMFDEVGSPNLKILVDTTAMTVAAETLEDWFATFGKDIYHTHFIDSAPYGHLCWGRGNADMQQYLETLRKYGYAGHLGQELTDSSYFEDPRSIDAINISAFEKFM